MSRRVFSDAERLFHDLLDRHEANPLASRIIGYVDEDGFASVEARDRFVAKLTSAQAAGAVEARHRRQFGERILSHIALREAEALYAHVGRIPARRRVADALAAARSRHDLPPVAALVLDEIAEAWSRSVSRMGLAPGDAPGLNDSLTLMAALAARAVAPETGLIDYRTFSRHAGTDSKALERLTKPVVALYRRLYSAEASTRGLDAEDFLATLGVSRTPQPLLISAELAHRGVRLPPLLYHGIPPEEGDGLELAGRPEYVLTIDNYTSFVRHVREVNADRSALVVYTGGFPARAHLRQIVRLAARADVEVFHWGDLDLGGVRIFHHLELALRERSVSLRPHLMGPDLLKHQGVPSDARCPAPMEAAADSAIASVWRALAETGLTLEQESLAPMHPSKEP
ncbi:MAG TPA: Wadjet anti-phage system protein JetD domain-containing protein [Allosphingosinicella sp.]|jgi:hypothetical protein